MRGFVMDMVPNGAYVPNAASHDEMIVCVVQCRFRTHRPSAATAAPRLAPAQPGAPLQVRVRLLLPPTHQRHAPCAG